MQAKTNNMKPEIVDNYMQKAIDVAEKVAPYRHARLSAVKLAGDPNNSAPFKDDATADELREEIMQDLGRLVSAGVIDRRAPRSGVKNRVLISGARVAGQAAIQLATRDQLLISESMSYGCAWKTACTALSRVASNNGPSPLVSTSG